MPGPDASSPTDPVLSRREKEQLLHKMYSLPHWIAVIRLFAYETLSMDVAQQKVKPLAEEYGKEPVASACETLVEIFMDDKKPFARLKRHIRQMAFQILGPEQPAVTVTAESPAPIPEKTRKKRSARVCTPVSLMAALIASAITSPNSFQTGSSKLSLYSTR